MIRNLTPHDLTIFDSDSTAKMVLPGAGKDAPRRNETVRPAHYVEAEGITVPVVSTTLGEISPPLPRPQPGVILVVSELIARAVRGRDDVLCPDTGPDSAVRDATGRIMGVRRLRRVH